MITPTSLQSSVLWRPLWQVVSNCTPERSTFWFRSALLLRFLYPERMDQGIPPLEFLSSNRDSISLKWQGNAVRYLLECRHISSVSRPCCKQYSSASTVSESLLATVRCTGIFTCQDCEMDSHCSGSASMRCNEIKCLSSASPTSFRERSIALLYRVSEATLALHCTSVQLRIKPARGREHHVLSNTNTGVFSLTVYTSIRVW